jgi:hypothetical protein
METGSKIPSLAIVKEYPLFLLMKPRCKLVLTRLGFGWLPESIHRQILGVYISRYREYVIY